MNESEAIQKLRGALADIAFSEDMTLDLARRKAKRIYEETAHLDSNGREGPA